MGEAERQVGCLAGQLTGWLVGWLVVWLPEDLFDDLGFSQCTLSVHCQHFRDDGTFEEAIGLD